MFAAYARGLVGDRVDGVDGAGRHADPQPSYLLTPHGDVDLAFEPEV